jgi:hypothetical protein
MAQIPTLEIAYTGRERKNAPAKQQQGKAWATKAQQDLPVNMGIKSQLLACKA